MKHWRSGVALVAVCAASRPMSAQARGWVPPDCQLSTSHYLVNSGLLYLQTAARTRFTDERDRQLKDARRVLLQAAEQGGQAQNPAVWYFLGRYYAEVNDVPGMDSAFTRAAALAPDCRADIRAHRRRLWVPVLNNAVDRIKAADHDAAIELLHRANRLYDGEPAGHYYMAQMYSAKGQPDTAIRYYRRAIEVARDSANRDNEQARQMLRDAIFNVASTYHQEKQFDSAVAWYRQFRQIEPGDAQAITRLADALEQAGDHESALLLYDSVLARADSMSPVDLFQAGVAMFEGGRFERAAQAFESGLRRNPHYRDALFNLANTYLSMANAADSLKGPEAAQRKKEMGEKMLPVAQRLQAVDPHNVPARRLKAAAFQLQNLQDSTLTVLEGIEAMPFEIQVSTFVPAGSGYDVRGIITNRGDSSLTVPPLVFEFLNANGEVVQAITVESKTLEGSGVAPIAMAPVGEGIVAWRYRLES